MCVVVVGGGGGRVDLKGWPMLPHTHHPDAAPWNIHKTLLVLTCKVHLKLFTYLNISIVFNIC